MPKKWYNYIVSVDDAAGTEPNSPNVPPNTRNVPSTPRSAAQSVADIASSIASEPKFTTPISDPTSFEELYGNATWSASEIQLLLASLTLDSDTPLSCLAVEMLPSSNPIPDPLGTGLGYERLLRTSPLVPVPGC